MVGRTKRAINKRQQFVTPPPEGIRADALAKVGSGQLARLAWLVGLLNCSPGTLVRASETEIEHLEHQAGVFCEPIGSFGHGPDFGLTANDLARLCHPNQDALSAC